MGVLHLTCIFLRTPITPHDLFPITPQYLIPHHTPVPHPPSHHSTSSPITPQYLIPHHTTVPPPHHTTVPHPPSHHSTSSLILLSDASLHAAPLRLARAAISSHTLYTPPATMETSLTLPGRRAALKSSKMVLSNGLSSAFSRERARAYSSCCSSVRSALSS